MAGQWIEVPGKGWRWNVGGNQFLDRDPAGSSPFAGARAANLARINADPRFSANPPAPAAPPPAAPPARPATPTASPPTTPAPAAPAPAAPAAPAPAAPAPAPPVASGGPNTDNVTPVALSDDDLAAQRRAAFLGAKDSMGGLKAVRGLLSDQLKARGGDPSAGGAIPSIKFLESELAKRQSSFGYGPVDAASDAEVRANFDRGARAPILSATQAYQGDRAAFEGQQAMGDAQVAALYGKQDVAPTAGGGNAMQIAFGGAALAPSGAARAAVNSYLQSDAFKQRLRASQQPLNEVAKWQVTPSPIPAPREEPGREGMLAAFAATGQPPPTTEGQGLLAAVAANPAGTGNGQSVTGATFDLGHVDPSKLKPLGTTGFRSGVSLGVNYQNPGNWGF